MSLVAYESSDGSENEEEEVQVKQNSSSNAQKPVIPILTDVAKPTVNVGLFSKLPPPKRLSASVEEDEDRITKKVSKKEPVKIILPSLREFEDDEEEKNQKDKRKPSMSGSGLIGMLPEPQHLTLKASSRKLIPLALTRKPVPVPAKKPIPSPNLSKPITIKAQDIVPQDDHTSDDENTTDFFSLTKMANNETGEQKAPIETHLKPKFDDATATPKDDYVVGTHLNQLPFAPNDYANSLSNNMNLPTMEYANSGYTGTDGESLPEAPRYGPTYPTGDSTNWDWNLQPSASSDTASDLLQNAALMRLTGKKQSGRENIQLLDVKGDDLVAGRDEWLLKSLSEENGYQSVARKSDQPSAMHRRKHQITYLAFQAKAREQELKNQWAMNRMTKRQTQSKYGF